MTPEKSRSLLLRIWSALLTLTLFVVCALIAAFRGHWAGVAIFVPMACVAAFMVWLRVKRNQPVSFMPALLIAMGGKRALPPKNEAPTKPGS